MPRKRKRGRPPVKVMPPPIPDTPEAIAMACMQGPPKQGWDYLTASPTNQKDRDSASA